MQRRSTFLLLKRAVHLGQKRSMEGGMSAAAAAATATPTPGVAATTRPPLPRQSLSTTTTSAATTTPQNPVRPATLVTPPAGGGGVSAAADGGSGVRRKKIIRRIVKRKKASATGDLSTTHNISPPHPPYVGTATTANISATTIANVAAAAAPVPPPQQPPSPYTTSRAQAMLSRIREQPEGALREEERHHHHLQSNLNNNTAVEDDAAVAESQEDDNDQQYHAVRYNDEEEVQQPAAAADTDEETNKSTARNYAEDMQALHDDTDESVDTTTSSRKTAMIKGFRIDEVSNLCSPSDAIFARRLPSGGCQFFAWPGTPLPVASKAIMSMPDTIRTVHAVFGRPGAPIDIVLDIDCQVPQEYWTMTKIRPFQMKLLDDVLSALKEEIEKIGESIETQVVLQSPNLKKASFHVHTKLKDAAFADFNSLYGFLSRFQERLPNVDMQIYRPHGMLRMFSCMKENHTSAIVVFDDPKWNLGFPGGKVSNEQAALHSVCVRDPSTFTRTLTFDSPRAYYGAGFNKADENDVDGDGSKRSPPQVRLPLTEKEAVENASRWLRMATEVEVGEWRTWIGLGLCAYRLAHHFRNAKGLPRPAMEELLDAWTEASRKCPLKFHQGECEARWATFAPDKLGDRSDWWGAYKRLGRLEAAAMEAAAMEAAEAERSKRASFRTTPAAATTAASPTRPNVRESVVPASRKLKQKRQAMHSAT